MVLTVLASLPPETKAYIHGAITGQCSQFVPIHALRVKRSFPVTHVSRVKRVRSNRQHGLVVHRHEVTKLRTRKVMLKHDGVQSTTKTRAVHEDSSPIPGLQMSPTRGHWWWTCAQDPRRPTQSGTRRSPQFA